MTIAAGFHCREGAVICADSEMTHADALKYNEEKIRFCYNDDVNMVLTGAGDDDFIRMAFNRVTDRITSRVKPINEFTQVEKILEEVVVGIYKKNIGALPPTQQFDTGLSLLAAITIKGAQKPKIIKVSDTALTYVYGFDCIGTGGALAKYVYKGLHEPTMSLNQAITLASYVVYAAKKNVPKCGGYTSIALAQQTGVRFDWEPQIAACEDYFHSFDTSVKPLFLACADELISEAEYQRQVECFVLALRQMREDKKELLPHLGLPPP